MRPPAASADTRFTCDDFVPFPDDGKRHEIIDGEHFVTPSPNVRHQRLVKRLLLEIALYLKANPYTGDQPYLVTEKNIQGPHWLVDPELDTVQVFRSSTEGKLARVVELTAEEGDVMTTPLLPGCAIDLRELFRASP